AADLLRPVRGDDRRARIAVRRVRLWGVQEGSRRGGGRRAGTDPGANRKAARRRGRARPDAGARRCPGPAGRARDHDAGQPAGGLPARRPRRLITSTVTPARLASIGVPRPASMGIPGSESLAGGGSARGLAEGGAECATVCTGSGGTRTPTGLTFPSSSKPQSSRRAAEGGSDSGLPSRVWSTRGRLA